MTESISEINNLTLKIDSLNINLDKLINLKKHNKYYALYLKFYYESFDKINNWYDILDKIDYNQVDVYIWIFDSQSRNILENANIIQCKNKYPNIKFITNYNETQFLTQTDLNFLTQFQNQNNIIHQLGHAISHLKSFLIPKNVKYIFNIDADDMFYPKFDIKYFNIICQYMDATQSKILTRPFHQWANSGWSFGFTIACVDILKYMNLNQIQGTNWETLDRQNKAYNLDNLFGHILLLQYKLLHKDLYFGLKDYDWRECEMDYLKSINAIMI